MKLMCPGPSVPELLSHIHCYRSLTLHTNGQSAWPSTNTGSRYRHRLEHQTRFRMAPHPPQLHPSTPQTSRRRQSLLPLGTASFLISLLDPFSILPSSQHLRLGFVTYGPQHCDNSPLFVKHFFALNAYDKLKDGPTLALGRTVTGGSLGMAVLEGYAAAIEVLVFCTLSALIRCPK